MKMTKEEALAQVEIAERTIESLERTIESLEQFIKAEDNKSEKNVVTQYPSSDGVELCINGRWAGNIYHSEEEGGGYRGTKASGHRASMYLGDLNGAWHNEAGEKVDGHLFYKPNA